MAALDGTSAEAARAVPRRPLAAASTSSLRLRPLPRPAAFFEARIVAGDAVGDIGGADKRARSAGGIFFGRS